MVSDLGSGGTEGQPPPDLLAGLVSARLCHDLVSPVGAIANGLEMMREIQGDTSEDFRMVDDSARRASALLRLLRLGFGTASDEATPLTARDLLDRWAVLKTPRIQIEAQIPDNALLRPSRARLATLMVMCCRAIVGREGRVLLTVSAGDGQITAEAVSATAEWSDRRMHLMDGLAPDDASPRDVEFMLLGPAAQGAKLALSRIADEWRAGIAAQPLASEAL